MTAEAAFRVRAFLDKWQEMYPRSDTIYGLGGLGAEADVLSVSDLDALVEFTLRSY